ncbi:MAG: hypothetical protein JXA94_05210 [Parachlamydiales bacterium]|nr:hypothetical protein [Parachlamydiales bacterium]
MKITLNDTGFFGDRLTFNAKSGFLKIANSILNFILSIFYLAPKDYTEENRKAISCFKKYLLERVGEDRLKRISNKVGVDFDKMHKKGSSLTSKHVVKVLIGTKDVSFSDLQELMDAVKENSRDFSWLSKDLVRKLKKIKKLDDLDKKSFDRLYKEYGTPLKDKADYEPIQGIISGRATKPIARYIFDPVLDMKERLQICETNDKLSLEGFYEKLSKIIASRLMEVGTIIKGPADKYGNPGYYRVAARLVTAKGMVSYVLNPATKDTKHLKPIRVVKTSGFKLANIDMLSFYHTDLEKYIGKTAFLSSLKYEKYLNKFNVDTAIGHSIGGCIVQHEMAYFNKIKNIYTYNSPGVPKYVLDKFNQRQTPSKIFIRRTTSDPIDLGGSYHLGYKANKNVDIDYKKFSIIERKNSTIHPHNIIFAENQATYKVDSSPFELNNLKRSNAENYRYYLGGHLLAPILDIIRKVGRLFIPSNAFLLKGLWIEDFDNDKYKPKFISSKSAKNETI